MKLLLVALCLVSSALAQDKYDDIDFTEVLNNDRLLTAYGKCLLDKGPCTAEIKQAKEKLPEVLATRCAKCTDKQKQMAKMLVQKVKSSRPDLWKELVSKYDPQGKYQQSFQDFLER